MVRAPIVKLKRSGGIEAEQRLIMSTSRDSTGWRTWLWWVLIANALIWGAVGAGAAWCLVCNRMIFGVLWVVFGLAASQLVLYAFLRQRRYHVKNLESLTRPVLATLEAQSAALDEQQRQIAVLQAASYQQLHQQVSSALNGRITPNLASVIEGLEQAEALLPDMLPQTRDWVARTRRLAANIFASLQTISGEITERPEG